MKRSESREEDKVLESVVKVVVSRDMDCGGSLGMSLSPCGVVKIWCE